MSPDPAPGGWDTPARLPFALDAAGERLATIELTEAIYRQASFLDERVLSLAGPPLWRPWAEAARAARGSGPDCDFVFHVGHVGSTLMARLLGDLPRVFALREPGLLRTLAQAGGEGGEGGEGRLEVVLTLLSRVWRIPQRALIKATSFVGEIAPAMLALTPAARSILMFASPQAYVAGILAGPASRRELDILAPGRIARLAARSGLAWDIGALGVGERAALAWACEMAALGRAASAFPARSLWVDFDRVLADPAGQLTRVLTHLHGAPDPADLATMLASPDLGRYAKAPEHAYDAALRRQVIGRSLADHGEEIERALDRLNRLGRDWPAFAATVTQAAAASRA